MEFKGGYLLFFILFIFIFLLYCAYLDIKTREVPTKVTYPFLAVGVIVNIIGFYFLNLIIALILYRIGYFLNKKNILGGVDIELLIIIFLFFGFKIFLLVCCIALFYCLAYSFITEKKKEIKFIPFIFIGYLISIVLTLVQ